MKTQKIILLTLGIQALFGSQMDEKSYLIQEYQEMFQKISQQREGISEGEILKIKSPFVTVIKKKKKKNYKNIKNKPSLTLEAIFSNKVMINGKWYSLYQKVGRYKIVAIKNESVILKDFENQKIKKLSLRNSNVSISIK